MVLILDIDIGIGISICIDIGMDVVQRLLRTIAGRQSNHKSRLILGMLFPLDPF